MQSDQAGVHASALAARSLVSVDGDFFLLLCLSRAGTGCRVNTASVCLKFVCCSSSSSCFSFSFVNVTGLGLKLVVPPASSSSCVGPHCLAACKLKIQGWGQKDLRRSNDQQPEPERGAPRPGRRPPSRTPAALRRAWLQRAPGPQSGQPGRGRRVQQGGPVAILSSDDMLAPLNTETLAKLEAFLPAPLRPSRPASEARTGMTIIWRSSAP